MMRAYKCFILIRIGQWPNTVYDAVSEVPPGTRGPLELTGLYPSRHSSALHNSWARSVWRPTPVHAGPPIVHVWVAAHQKISAIGALRRPLLPQGSRPTWVKPSRRPKNPPRPYARPSTLSYFTQAHWCYHKAYSQEDPSGLPYRHAPIPPTWPQRSPRRPPPTPSHRRPSGAAKEIKILHDQQRVKPGHPVRPPTQTVTSRQWQILEGVTATQIMSSLPKTHPRARPTRRTSRDTPAN